VRLWLPYGRTELPIDVPDENLAGVLEKEPLPGLTDPREAIIAAMEKPLDSPPLRELVQPDHRVVIVVDDHTRPAPTRTMLPPVLEFLEEHGVRRDAVTILFACGSHRAVKPEEAAQLLGPEVASKYRWVSHDARDYANLVYVGKTSRGNEVYLNRLYVEADCRIVLGDVEYHYYAGYGGGRKSVLPGVSGIQTIEFNHAMLIHPNARIGVLDGNPIHEDMTEAASLCPPHFTINVVQNPREEIVAVFGGHFDRVLREGAKVVDRMYRVEVEEPADVVVVAANGHPHDVDLYQAYKALHVAAMVCREGGVLILVAECGEGYGSEKFLRYMTQYRSAKECGEALQRKFELGGHKAYYLLQVLEHYTVYLVSAMPRRLAEEMFRLRVADSPNDALQAAFRQVGRKARVLVIPRGSTTLPVVKTRCGERGSRG